MKSVFRLSAIVLLLVLAISCKPSKINAWEVGKTPSGPIVERRFSIGKFSALEVGNGITVNVILGSKPSLTISAPEDLFEYLRVENEGSTLELGYKQGVNLKKHVNVTATLTAPSLNDIMATTSSVVNMKEAIKAGNVNIGATTSASINLGKIEAKNVQIHTTTSGSCNIRNIDADYIKVTSTTSASSIVEMLDCDALVASSTTSGTCKVAGEAKTVKLSATTSGTINARSLKAGKSCNLSVTTGANIFFDTDGARKNGASVEVSKTTGGSIGR